MALNLSALETYRKERKSNFNSSTFDLPKKKESNLDFSALESLKKPTIPTYSDLMSAIKPSLVSTVDISKKITPSQEAKLKQEIPQKFGDVPKLDWYDKWKDIGSRPKQLIPFVASGAEAIRFSKLLTAAYRLDKNTETDDDLKLLKDYIDTSNVDTTFGYKVWDVISGMPSFFGEIFATGGIATATRIGAKKTLKKLVTKKGKKMLEKKLAQRGIGLTAEIIARTAQAPIAGITRIPASTIEKQLQSKLKEITTGEKKENLGLSITKAFGEQWIEILSEFSGGLFTSLSKPIKNKFLKVALFASFQKANPTASPTALVKVVKKMGWNGIISEMFEERMADVGHGILHSIGAGDQKFKLPSAEQLAIEFVAFSVPGVAISSLSRYDPDLKSIEGKAKGLTLKDVSKEIDELKSREEQLKEEIKSKRGIAINEKIELAKVRKKIEEIGEVKKEIPEVPELIKAIKEVKSISTKEQELSQILRGTKGMTADDIMNKYPNIQLKRDVPAKDIHGNKVEIPEGEKLTPYELKGNKILLQDGEPYIVSKNQFANIKGQSTVAEGKPFAPELKGLEESIKEYPADRRQRLDTAFRKGEMTNEEYLIEKGKMNVDTKYSQYQLPGGKDYKEILIKAPAEERKPIFTSSHYPDEKNPISHLRMKEYENKKYGEVSFMEELQSDWAGEGRKRGFAEEGYKEPMSLTQWLEQNNREYTQQATRDYETYNKSIPYRIPSHPLVKGNKWQELTIKRALREAIDNKSDYFAWITGEQTKARYNLQLKKITYAKKVGNEPMKIIADGQKITANSAQENEMYKLLGERSKELKQGIDLSKNPVKMEAKWAYNLYDKQVKNIVEKLTGQKVEMLDMGLPIEKTKEVLKTTKQQGIKLTPEVKNKIKGIAPEIKTSGKMFERVKLIKKEIPEVPELKEVTKKAKAIDALKMVEEIKEVKPKKKVIKRPPSLIKLGIKKRAKTITKAEDILLKSQIRAEARTARKAVAKTRKETREKILKDIKEKKKSIENIKQAIYDYSKELPISLRGKLLGKMKNVNTYKGLEEQVSPLVAKLKERYSRKVITKEIKKIYKRVKYKKQSGRRVDRRYDSNIQEILIKFGEASKLSKSEAQILIDESLSKYDATEKDKMMPANEAMDNRILSMASGMKNMSLTELIALRDVISNMENTGAIVGALKKFNREAKEKAQIEKAIDIITTEEGLAKDIEIKGSRYKHENIIGFFNLFPLLKTKEGRQKIKNASNNKLITLFKGMVGWKDMMDILSYNDKNSLPWQSWLSKHFNLTEYESNYKEGLAIQNKNLGKMYRESYELNTEREMKKKMTEDTQRESLGVFETKIDGKKESIDFEFSKSEARYIWMTQQDPLLKKSFMEGMHYTEEMINTIDNFLSEKDKNFCKKQLEWYKKYYDEINKVYRELNGVDLPFNEFYIRIRRGDLAKDVQSTFSDDLALRRSLHKGSFKLRVPNTQLIKTSNDITVMQTHIAEMEHYKAFGLKNRDINVIFGDAKVRSAIIQEYGKGFLGLIDNFRDTIAQTGKENAYLLDGWEKLRARFVTGVLAARPTIAFKQLVSFIAYADSIPVTEFIKGNIDFWKHPIERYKFLKKHSKFFKYRGENIERDLKTASQSDAYAAFREKPSFINMLMINIRLGDKSAILTGGWSIYKYHYNQAIKAGKNETEAIKEGIKEFESISSATQQSSAAADQSYWQRANPVMKMFTTFMSSPNLYFRKMIGAIRNLESGRGSKKQHAKTLVIYWFLIPILFQFISDFGRWDEKEQKRAMIFGPLNGMFIIGDGLDFILREVMRFDIFNKPGEEKIARFGQNEIWQTVFSDTVKALKSTVDMVDDPTMEDFLQAIEGWSNISGKATGLPLKYGYDITRGVADTMSGEYIKGIGEMAGWSEYIIKEKVKDEKKSAKEKLKEEWRKKLGITKPKTKEDLKEEWRKKLGIIE